MFPLSSDTAWLGAFLRLGGVRRAIDLGCGGGALALQILGRRPETKVTGLDILPEAAERTRLNGLLNGWEIRTVCGDIRDCPDLFPAGSFDLAAGNLPYWPGNSPPAAGERDRARRERCAPAEVCRAAAWLLGQGGRLCLVYPPSRLSELFCGMTAAGIEPKRLRLVQKPGKAPCAALTEGIRGARPGLSVEPVLLLDEED